MTTTLIEDINSLLSAVKDKARGYRMVEYITAHGLLRRRETRLTVLLAH
jgi:hypothetical protein